MFEKHSYSKYKRLNPGAHPLIPPSHSTTASQKAQELSPSLTAIPLSTQMAISPTHAPPRLFLVSIFPPRPSLTLCNSILPPKRLGPPSGADTASHPTTSPLPSTCPVTASHQQAPERQPIILVPRPGPPAPCPLCLAPPVPPSQPRTPRP